MGAMEGKMFAIWVGRQLANLTPDQLEKLKPPVKADASPPPPVRDEAARE